MSPIYRKRPKAEGPQRGEAEKEDNRMRKDTKAEESKWKELERQRWKEWKLYREESQWKGGGNDIKWE